MKNPIKLVRELNPPANTASIASLEGVSQAAARKQIAQDLSGEDFAAFINRVGGPSGQRPVAVLPKKIRQALGSQSGIVRLSSSTVAKQRRHRQGQAFTAGDYHRVQDMLDKGMVLEEGPGKIMVFQTDANSKIWRAVLKATDDKSEAYLQTLHRTDSRRLRSLAKRHQILRKEKR